MYSNENNRNENKVIVIRKILLVLLLQTLCIIPIGLVIFL